MEEKADLFTPELKLYHQHPTSLPHAAEFQQCHFNTERQAGKH